MRVAWRLLPHPYTMSIAIIWTLTLLIKTRKLSAVVDVWRTLWKERSLLASERKPIRPATVAYLRAIGARLLY
jgi:hypothetical protein